MIYIISDIHGLWDRYEKLLDRLDLKDDDTLYVLGDVIDRGPDGIRILLDMMERGNIVMFLGNHEHMMLMHLEGRDTRSWLLPNNGGRVTLRTFEALDPSVRNRIVSYLYDSWLVKHLVIAGKRYSLSHVGVFRNGRDLRTREVDLKASQDMAWGQYYYNPAMIGAYPEELCPMTFISGHIITRRYRDIYFDDDTIYEKTFENGCRYIDIDCGCALGGGRGNLACIAVNDDGETGEPFYIR